MALDTKEKRFNVAGITRHAIRVKLPQASKDQQWRVASGNAYGGFTLSPFVPVVFTELNANRVSAHRQDAQHHKL